MRQTNNRFSDSAQSNSQIAPLPIPNLGKKATEPAGPAPDCMAHANNSGKVTRIYAKPRAVAKLADRTPWIVAGLFALLILSAIGAGYLGLVVLRWA